MSTANTIALITAISSALSVVVFAAGYYMLARIYGWANAEMQRDRQARGRPQVIVTDNYSNLPHVAIVVNNISNGAAKEITFEFSAPVVSSDGAVISNLSYFKDGMDFLSPEGKVSAYWDDLNKLLPLLREKGLEDGISVTTRYKDLAGEYYETEWNLNPFIYQDDRYIYNKDIPDLVEGVERIAPEDAASGRRYKMYTGSGDELHEKSAEDDGEGRSGRSL